MQGPSTAESDDLRNFASDPVSAFLVSDLLTFELDDQKRSVENGVWKLGNKLVDSALPKSLWSSGKVIGVASVEGSPSLPPYIIAHHLIRRSKLLNKPKYDEDDISAFMITQPNSMNVSTVYHILQNSLDDLQDLDAMKLLDSVRILQPLDLTGLAESLAEVSSSLYTLSINPHTSRQPVVLHLTSVASLLSSPSSHSNTSMTRSTALLTNLLRTLTRLSRTYPELLVLVDLDLYVTRQGPRPPPQTRQSDNGHELQFAFASSTGAVLQLRAPISGSIAQSLEHVCDTIVAIHRPEQMQYVMGGGSEAEWVVEVVKDRINGSQGVWHPWKDEDVPARVR